MVSQECKDRGVIVKIAVENFVTYKKVEIKPGRGLNVIIGPNGTGKSTVLTAILIGLGGNPATLGKKNKVADFIKAGCTKASIEIVLKDTLNRTVKLGRVFDIKQSVFYKNNEQVNSIVFKETVESFNIQLDNLCQFLPQDKVQDFSKMNPQELLINTEKSVGDGSLNTDHEQLISKRQKQRKIEEDLQSTQNVLDNERNRFENLAVTVGSIKERKAQKKKVTIIEQKLAWMTYNESRLRLTEAMNKHKQAEKRKDELKEQLVPVDEVIRNLTKEVNEMNKKVTHHNSVMSSNDDRCRVLLQEINKIREEIKKTEQVCNRRLDEEKSRDGDIAQANLQKGKIENDLKSMIDEIGSLDSLTQSSEELKNKMNQQRRLINNNESKMNGLNQQSDNLRREITALKREQQSIQDIETKKLELLKDHNNHAYQGVMWLRQNTDKFKSTIHEPMMMSIQPHHERYAKFFETCIPTRDLFAFVCEDVDDMSLLLKYLRDQKKLTVNVIHSDPLAPVHKAPSISIDNLRQFGFENYLSELVDAPPTIMKYLINMHAINNIPIGSREVDKNIDRIPTGLRRYFSPTNYLNISFSAYSGKKSTSYNTISSNGCLSIIVDTQKIQVIENKLMEKTDQLLQLTNEINNFQNTITVEKENVNVLQNEKIVLTRNINSLVALHKRLEITNQRIENLEEERQSSEVIKAETTKQIQLYINKQLQYFDRINTFFINASKMITESEQINFKIKLKTKVLATRKNESEDIRIKYREACDIVRDMDEHIKPYKEKTYELLKKAQDLTGGYSPNNVAAFKKYEDAFAKYPDERNKLEKKLADAKTKVHCTDNHENAEQVLKDYDALDKSIRELTEKITRLQNQLTVNRREVDELKEKWLAPLQVLVGEINKNFSKHFRDMKCAGEVSLDQSENPDDFEKYGLKIRVKFRAADDLHDFTRNRQSGGERAVTTGIFMIALQELSTVPFRCVDELNQGMDATNEKMVFDLITRITAIQGSSQYFLLTPKLLPNLKYGRHVTVHCVFNGPFVLPTDEFSVSNFCDQLTRSV